MSLIQDIIARAKADKQRIVLPEGTEERTIKAADQLLKDEVADIILIGNPSEIKELAKQHKLSHIDKATIVDPLHNDKKEVYTNLLFELRKKKGMTLEQAEKLAENPLYLGCLMIKNGDADGEIAVMPNPNAQELAEIAISTAQTTRALVGVEPRVAMLSFSTKGSAKSELADKVIEATRIAKEMAPELQIDGELQADAALVPSIGNSKAPGSPTAGKANVLVFPNLECGNISYKLVQRLGNAVALGPILQGIAAPVNDLSRGCSVDDIYKLVAICANQAINNPK